jgi:hypothetical protein
MRFLAGFLAGLVWSNWIEYAYHRWAMHWPSLYQAAAMRHALHHSAPSNPQHITMNFGFRTAIFITNVLLFAVPDQLLHLRILTGVSAAFLTYMVVGIEVHLRIHDGRWGAGCLEGTSFVTPCQAPKELQHLSACIRLASRDTKQGFSPRIPTSKTRLRKASFTRS